MCDFWMTERSWIESLNETHGCDNWSLRKEFTGAIMNLATAINVFLRQSLRVGGFPFDIRMERTNLFKKDYKLAIKRQLDIGIENNLLILTMARRTLQFMDTQHCIVFYFTLVSPLYTSGIQYPDFIRPQTFFPTYSTLVRWNVLFFLNTAYPCFLRHFFFTALDIVSYFTRFVLFAPALVLR